MRLSKKTEYALLALIDLAKIYPNDSKTINAISIDNNIPKKYLEQILLLLKTSAYVKSIRGSSGGYLLTKSPSDISIAEIIRLIDGPLAPVHSASVYYYEESPIEINTKLLDLFIDIRNYAANLLENTSISDLL